VMRKSTEKTLARANDELHSALQEAITCQETLSNEVIDIQQRYTEVLAMLHDAEEELRVHRQRPTPHRRTHSADSLYDSLASELEASDSGFYASPSSSARRTDDSHLMTDRVTERDTSAIVDVPSTVLASLHAPIDHHLQSHNFKCNSGKMTECPNGSTLGSTPGRRADSPISLLFGQSETSIVHCSTPIRRRTSSRASIESLGSYDGPALGEPGRPGTRDFDFSIRRLRIQLEKDYAIFRKQRHLCISPIPIASLPTRGSRGDLIGGGLLDAISPVEASKQVLTRESTGSRIAFSLHTASPRSVSSSFSSSKRVVVPE